MRAAALALCLLLLPAAQAAVELGAAPVAPALLPSEPPKPFPEGPPNDPGYDRAERDPLNHTIFDEQWNLFGFIPRTTPLAQDEHASGVSADKAWRVTIGRPDVRIAVLDSGIYWEDRELVRKMALSPGELPLPQGCAVHDCNGDGAVSAQDYAGDPRVGDRNGNGVLDAQDVLRAFSDGLDQDANGYVDDIAGWDFWRGDNDAEDEVRFGHGTGEAKGSAAETDNGIGEAGVCPRCMVVPLRIGDSFVVHGDEFALAVLYAADHGIDVVQAAIGAVSWSPTVRAALEYAWARDTLVVLSAADEDSFHHNMPGPLGPALVTKSVVPDTEGSPTRAWETTTYLNHPACTNWGARIDLATPSGSCSSGATEVLAGVAGLVKSRAKEMGIALSPPQMKQLLTLTAEDIHKPESQLGAVSLKYPSGPAWDPYFGYGRTHAFRAVAAVQDGNTPTVADIVQPRWFEPIPWPGHAFELPIVGRVGNPLIPTHYMVEVGRGLVPPVWVKVGEGEFPEGIHEGVLAVWHPDLAPNAPPRHPDEFTWTLRLSAWPTFDHGFPAEARRAFELCKDPELTAFVDLGASAESSPALADLDGDGRPEVLLADGGGRVHALRVDGSAVPGWPVHTDVMEEAAKHLAAPAFASGAVPPPRDAFVASVAVGDLGGRPIVVAASLTGEVYAWSADGARLPGFPVSSDHRLADSPGPRNRVRWGFLSTPALADLDGDGKPEIVVGGYDQHLHAWRSDGGALPGFPVKLHDAAFAGSFDVGNKVVSSPAVADLDGDGRLDIVVGTNEVYKEPQPFELQPLGGLDEGGSARVYAVHGDGDLHAGGPFLRGWPARPTSIQPRALPLVGSGVPMSPSIATVEGQPRVAVSGFAGMVTLYSGDGTVWRTLLGLPGPAELDAGLPTVANGAWGDLDGDGSPDYVLGLTGAKAAPRFAVQGRRLDWRTQLTAWDPLAPLPSPLPGWPQPMEDWMFFAQPALGDVDGDAKPEVLAGSGGYLLWARHADGSVPHDAPGGFSTWPKMTGGWMTSTPALGDLDGDGTNEVVAATREGFVFVWGTKGIGASPWPMFKHDAARSGGLG